MVALVGDQVAAPAVVPSVDDILSVLIEPPSPGSNLPHPPGFREHVHPRPRIGFDYLGAEARNRSLGAAGEEFVLRFETARLIRAGEERLAGRVERVTETRGDGLGFDVLSFEVSGAERLIEVKTTAYGPSTPFFVTRNELDVSREAGERYHLYRAFNFRREPRLYAKRGSLELVFRLEASQFVAAIG